MAINTETKRRSTIALIPPLPVADTAVDAADRAHVIWLYSSAAAEPSEPDSIGLTLIARDMALELASRSASLTLIARE